MKRLLNSTVRTLLVGKVDLGAFLTEEQIQFDLVSNLNDCFLISPECSENMEVTFTLPKSFKEQHDIEDNTADLCPIEGDKFIGENRDKGSVTKVCRKYIPFIKFKFTSQEEYARFKDFVLSIGKQVYFDNESKLSFETQADVIANPSTGRDNVGALVANSTLEYDAIINGKDEYQLTVDETLNLDIVALADKYPCGFEMVLRDDENNLRVVYSFGEVPVMIEDFFWQPQHGNRFALKEKEISLNYNQARDCLKVLVPTLAECVVKSANFNSIKEDMLLLGLKIGTATDVATYENLNTNNTNVNEDDIFNSEVI